MKIPKTIYSVKGNIMFMVGLVLFVMLFMIVYTPGYSMTGGGIGRWYEEEGLCLPVCSAIVLATTAVSRFVLLVGRRASRLGEGEYLVWQFCEVSLAGVFCTLFLSLYLGLPFFGLLPSVLLIYISIAVFPYAFYWLLAERLDRDVRLATAQRTIMSLRQGAAEGDGDTIRFVDEKGSVKLIVSADRVIMIESAGNYVTILYENNQRLMRYSLRNTLKGIEEVCEGHSLVRCHRSYFVNLRRVKLLRRGSDGVYAEMDCEGVEDVPVSKSYAAEVMQRFTN